MRVMELKTESQKISTLVFFDLETSGLPKSNPKITEIAVVAVERNVLLSNESPRVLNKLIITVNPMKKVDPGAERITGLNLDKLSRFPALNKESLTMLHMFFKNLPPPICLLAHNGSNFDFRLLRSELSILNSNDFDNILCADTLDGLKTLDKAGLLENPVTFKSQISSKVNKGKNQAKKMVNITLKRAHSDTSVLLQNSPIVAKGVEVSGMEPEKKKARKSPHSFSLSNLYKYFFKKNAEGCHSAEGDCLSLLKICQLNSLHFLSWVDQNAKELSKYDKMW